MYRRLLLPTALLFTACSNAGPTATAATPAATTHVNGTVEGIYRASGQDVKMKYVFIAKGDHQYDGKPIYDIVFTEKDAAREPSVDAITFSDDYGAILKVTEYNEKEGEYSIISESYHHPGIQQKHPGGTGTLYLKDVVIANGEMSGELFTQPKANIFGQALEVDLKFKAAMPN